MKKILIGFIITVSIISVVFGCLASRETGSPEPEVLYEETSEDMLCSVMDQNPDILQEIRDRGTLIVLTRKAPTTYFEDRKGPRGFEYELVKAFANHLGVRLEIKVLNSVSEILEAMEQGYGDIAAAGIARTSDRERRLTFGPSYQIIEYQVVCRRGSFIPRKMEDLHKQNMLINSGSNHEERLAQIKSDFPALQWKTVNCFSTEQLLEKVWKKEIDCTVADSNTIAINKLYYPELTVAFSLGETEPLAWVLRGKGEDLKKVLESWMLDIVDSGDLDALNYKYYGHVRSFDYVDIAIYHRRIQNRLPLYQPLFEEAADKYELPWELVAAQSYQESHWDINAESPTGVRGLMMLTRTTADCLGIKNRLDPYESIMGGAEYIAQLLKRVPVSIKGKNRLYIALAAYNIGMGHIYDARTLARKLGKNPDLWVDLKEILPLLAEKEYYKDLKHGYARGTEPVQYVERITNYNHILNKNSRRISTIRIQSNTAL